MRPTFMGFETATRGLMVNQKALDIVGNNVTNIGVTGYTRQRVDLVSLSVNMRYTRYNQNSTSFAGQGVGVYGVSQIRDSFLDKRFREEYSDVGYYTETASVLADLHGALDEISPATMSTAMTNFYNEWEGLTQKTNETTGAANLLSQATQIVQVFRQMSAKLDNVWHQQEYSLKLNVNDVNSLLERIAQLNDTISKERFNSMDVGNRNYKPLELVDQRNVLLDQLSAYGDISYVEQPDGQVTVKFGGHIAVEGDKFEKLHMRTNETDEYFKTVTVFWNDTGKEVATSSGSLRGSLDMLNGRGLAADGTKGESFTQGILYYKDKIDQFAYTFADAFNNVVEIADVSDPDNPVPFDPPKYKQLFSFSSDNYMNAANIQISTDWDSDATYLISDVMDKLENMEGGRDDNSYAAKAKNLFKDRLDFGEFKGSIQDYIVFYSNSKLNNDKAYADSRLEAVSSIADDLLNQIQQVSGVSMEEEGVDMMMYKKAYDAVSRVFTTLDEMLDKLINGTGVVGR